ncbi:protocadherin-15-like isoform X2 [Alosa alosa]|uniref:protocadherin-15-like isoform X2 n=1 Tax=Alosa alosa TaxID=278164 RepID=UPI0020150EA6|nr:protocadherin-15-like isoform X2 [Alosa alosa]
MRTSPYVWIVILSAWWFTDFIHSLPVETTIDCTTGTTVSLGEVDEKYAGDIDSIISIPSGTELTPDFTQCPQCEQFLEFVYVVSITNATVKTKTPLDAEALTETGGILSYSITCASTGVTNGRIVRIRDLNDNAPIFEKAEYIANIAGTLSEGEVVVQVKAVDADASPINNRITYSLLATESSATFAVEPSSGQVYVVSAAGQIENVSLQVMASDPHGLNDTTTVKVMIWESRDVVVISLNQKIGTVQNKSLEMKEALERALGWSVNIISVSSSRGGLALSRTIEIHTLQRKNTPRTYVSFIATEINGTNVIPKETVQTKLLDDEENVLAEMQQVFGPSLRYEVVDDGSLSTPNIPIILETVIPVIFIVSAISIWCVHKKCQSNTKKQHSDMHLSNIGGVDTTDYTGDTSDLAGDTDSMREGPNLAGDTDSMREGPNLAGDTDSMREGPNLAGDTDSMREGPNF